MYQPLYFFNKELDLPVAVATDTPNAAPHRLAIYDPLTRYLIDTLKS